MEFLEEYVPESFRNVIISASFEPNNHFHSVIRTNVNNYKDCDAWVAEFGRNTKTKWIVRHTKPKAQRLVCRKKYVCHHSDFQKKPNVVHGRKSKNFSCKAFINIRVKLTTLETKKKDSYVRDGLPAIITMNNYHSHEHLASEALEYLSPSDEVRSSFEGYFNDGLGLKEAISVHEAKLQLLGLVDLTDASVNPKYDTVKYWLSNWRRANLLCDDLNDSVQGPSCSMDDDDFVTGDVDDKNFEEVVKLMKIQNDRFGTSDFLVDKVVKRLKAVNSSAGWNAFLNSAGSNLIVRKRKRKYRSCISEDALVDNALDSVSDVDIAKNRETFINLDKKDTCCIVRIKEEVR